MLSCLRSTPWRRCVAALLLTGPLTVAAASSPGVTPPAACPPQATAPTPAQLQAAQAQARDRGALWRISRDGRVSWLYGTLHVGKLDWAVPGPQTLGALRSVDAVALELNPADPATTEALTRSDGLAPLAAPPALQERLARQTAAACLPNQALAALHPMQQLMALVVLDARWVGLDPGYGVEHVLTGFAQAIQRPVIALETVAQQMQALVPPQPDAALQAMESVLDQLETGQARQVLAKLANAWAEGDLDTVARYEDWCECIGNEQDRAALRRLNDDRNPHLADRIAALHGGGQRLFAAVGLLHMTGEQSLPRLMAERGFTVERVQLH